METYSRLDEFYVIKVLGKGGFGKVKLGRKVDTGEYFALKILPKTSRNPQAIEQALINEFTISTQLNHPFIIQVLDLRFIGSYVNKNNGPKNFRPYAVIELAPRGEFFNFIVHARSFDENLTRFYFKQLLEAIQYLHGKNVSHRDLKLDNILVDANFNIKLADFGFATVVDSTSLKFTRLGTRPYMAPNIHSEAFYDAKKADIFALGVILFVLFSGHFPFKEAVDSDDTYRMFKVSKLAFWNYHSNYGLKPVYSASFKDLIEKMLEPNDNARYSIADVKASAWVNQAMDEGLAQNAMKNYAANMNQVVIVNDYNPLNFQVDHNMRSDSTEAPVNFLMPISEDVSHVRIKSLAAASQSGGCDLRLKLKNQQDLLRFVINLAKHCGAEVTTDTNKRVGLAFEAGKNQGKGSMELALYRLDGEDGFFGVDILNVDSDYIDFHARRAHILQEARLFAA